MRTAVLCHAMPFSVKRFKYLNLTHINTAEVLVLKKLQLSFVPVYGLIFILTIIVAFICGRAVTAISVSAPLAGRHIIAIDAGHGGEDGGATSCTGVLESNINLSIALRLNDLCHLLGYDTIMVRSTDTALHTSGDTIAARKSSDLKARVALANSTDNCIWISIHQNYFSDDRYSGAQIFYANTRNSDILGKQLQSNILKTINRGSNRQAKKIEGVYLFDHITATGVLVECGFLSNREEEAKLQRVDYQQNICCVIAATVGEFLLS